MCVCVCVSVCVCYTLHIANKVLESVISAHYVVDWYLLLELFFV